MDDFIYKDDELFCEDLRVADIAEKLGTPFYLYSKHTLVNHYQVLDEAFSGVPHLICYSVKANSNVALLKLLANEGSGADIVSGGELLRCVGYKIRNARYRICGARATRSVVRGGLEITYGKLVRYKKSIMHSTLICIASWFMYRKFILLILFQGERV